MAGHCTSRSLWSIRSAGARCREDALEEVGPDAIPAPPSGGPPLRLAAADLEAYAAFVSIRGAVTVNGRRWSQRGDWQRRAR
jgi:hypothetical protein